MTNAAKEVAQAAQTQMPPGHPAGQFIHQPPEKAKFEPNKTHELLFGALATMKETAGGHSADVSLHDSAAALMIAYMTEELGEKKLAKLTVKEAQDWVVAFKRQNPRQWIAFARGQGKVGNPIQLENDLSRDKTRPAKSVVEWQHAVSEILKSKPPAE